MRNLIRKTGESQQCESAPAPEAMEEQARLERATSVKASASDRRLSSDTSVDNKEESMFCNDEEDIFAAHHNNENSQQRYFINRLYQPINGPDEPAEALADDEYLFYQELRFFESTVQELSGGTDDAAEDDGVSFSKMLEEEDENDVNRLCDEIERQVEDEDLHLTTIIDSFSHSFGTDRTPNTSTPPLIESSSDPMMTEACHDQPDSSSSTRTQIHLVDNHHLITTPTGEQLPFMNCNNSSTGVVDHSLQLPMNHVQDQSQHFEPIGSVDDHLRHHQDYESTQHHLHHHFQHNQLIDDQHHQPMSHSGLTLNDPSGLQQQVSSSLASSFNSTLEHSFADTFQEQQVQQHNNQTSHTKQQIVATDQQVDLKTTFNEAGKRYMVEDEEGLVQRKKQCNIQQQHSPSATKVTSSNNYVDSIKTQYSPMDSPSFRLEDEEPGNITTDDETEGAGKQPPQMVKYRRRTANARERIRMREINQAFEKLKKVVPVELIHTVSAGYESDSNMKPRNGPGKSLEQKSSTDTQAIKLTKITTLRLAVSYISKLSELLQQQEGGNSPVVISSTADYHERSAKKSVSTTGRLSAAGDKRSRKGGGRTAKAQKSLGKLKSKFNSKIQDSQPEVREQDALAAQQQTQKQIPQNFIIGSIQQPANSNGLQLKQQPATLQMMQTYSPQTVTISQQTANQSVPNRTFVTPVAVAILGIQTTGNHQRSSTTPNEPQALQLLGLQSAHQLHHQRQLPQTYYTQAQQQAPPATGVSQQQYNLISTQHQPQQLTFTLNSDMNGLSVLRLASTKSVTGGQIHCQPIIQQQRPVVGSYTNYTAYQPVRISQTTASSPALVTSSGELQTANATDSNMDSEPSEHSNRNNSSKLIIPERQPAENNQSVAMGDTGKISAGHQFKNQTLMRQQNNGNLIQAYEVKYGERSSQVTANGGTMLAIGAPTSGEQVIQQQHHRQQATAGGLDWVYRPHPSHIIYLSPSSLSGSKQGAHIQQMQVSAHQSRQHQSLNQPMPQTIVQGVEAGDSCTNPAELKFATSQFSSQPPAAASKLHSSQEANIRQLVASLTTSIHPQRTSGELAANGPQGRAEERSGEQPQQRQQLKRTYRFHNYDGTMITNHLYGSSHHNQTEQQAKRMQQQQVGASLAAEQQQSVQQPGSVSQRSRLNSLSSTCSATSSSSSSTFMSSSRASASPTVAAVQVVAIKSSGEGSTAASVSG